MNIGLDVGYSAVKAYGGTDRKVSFPSVVGTPDRARFSVNGSNGDILLDVPGDGRWLVGDGAVAQSRFLDRREDRNWIESDAYRRLMLASFTELTTATSCDNLRQSLRVPSLKHVRLTLAERSLSDFIRLYRRCIDLSPYCNNWHIEEICDHLQAGSGRAQ